ncbi:hypothetical protein [Desulfosporosinus fructosivorans]
MEITLLRPKDTTQKTIEITLSERNVKLLQYYAEYCQRSQDDIVDHYLEEIFKLDSKFQEWGSGKRNNKQFMRFINEISSENVYDPEMLDIFSETEHEQSDI